MTPCGADAAIPTETAWTSDPRNHKGQKNCRCRLLRLGDPVRTVDNCNTAHQRISPKVPPPGPQRLPLSPGPRHLRFPLALWHQASFQSPGFHPGALQTLPLRIKVLLKQLSDLFNFSNDPVHLGQDPRCHGPQVPQDPASGQLSALCCRQPCPIYSAAATLTFLLCLGNAQHFLTSGPLTRLFPLLGHIALRLAPS